MLRIGLIYPSKTPASPANWSGTPMGLARGFRSAGAEVVEIPCHIAEPIRAAVAVMARMRAARGSIAHREPVYIAARSIAINKAARRASIDGIVAMGTDLYDLSLAMRGISVPVATYDDGNFALFSRYPDSELVRDYPEDAIRRWARRQADACRFATAVCVSTAWAKRSMVEDFGLPVSKVRVVGMGHRPRLAPLANKDWRTPRFLFVGVDWKRKNGAAVVEAFLRIRDRIPTATLDLVGEHPPIKSPSITGHGFLAREDKQAQRTLDNLFARATVFLLPSLFDPSPIACLEAASAGLPVVATRCGGANELLGDAAIAVDPYDKEALAAAMLRLADAKVAEVMGRRALARAADSTWEAVADRIAKSLAEGPATRRDRI